MNTSPWVLPLLSGPGQPVADLKVCGGKGVGLQRALGAGIKVPDGFVVSVQGYQAFLREHNLDAYIAQQLQDTDLGDLTQLRRLADELQAHMQSLAVPEALCEDVRAAYIRLGSPAVAVRSSATAEDLPELSFAGQHDSWLNISGADQITDHIRACWTSLWTARAIAYRQRAGIPHQRVAMAVVVQRMIAADVSGVLFTQNPMRAGEDDTPDTMVVDAATGTAEALVSGEVVPDHFVINRTDFKVIEPHLENRKSDAILTGVQLVRLGKLGLQLEQLFGGTPQDVEWAFAADELWLLQSRPITTGATRQFSWAAPYPGARLVRRQIVENMPRPLSPLFETLYLHDALDRAMDKLVSDMGLPMNVDDFIRRPIFTTVNGFGYCRYELNASWRVLRLLPRILWWYIRTLPGWLSTLVPNWQQTGLPHYQQAIDTWRGRDLSDLDEGDLYDAIVMLARADAEHWFHITLVMGAAKVSEAALDKFLRSALMRRAAGGEGAAALLRGFDSPTLQAQQYLVDLAEQVRSNPHLEASSVDITDYLQRYGHQVYNLDFAEPTLSENSTLVRLTLQSLTSQRPALTPAQQQLQLISARDALAEKIRLRSGPIRRRLFERLLSWSLQYAPHREHALFYMGAAWPTLRRIAAVLGARLTQRQVLSEPSDIYYLKADELARLTTDPHRAAHSYRQQIRQRRQRRRDQARLHPPRRVPEDLRFKFGPLDFTRWFETWETQKHNSQSTDTLSGFAVSPGRVTGIACVIISPDDFHLMQPGAILVCPTTTPAWTPLFSQAAALVTDIGAVLAHGSIVAREYGIPAVLGTGNATTRITSGQRIIVDGSKGTVTLL